MPRAGGESAKLGDDYERIWTVDSLLDLLSDDVISLEPEPVDPEESEGIEFVKRLSDGTLEYHSVKRQKVGSGWSLADLSRPNPSGRSILKDLFLKLTSDRLARCVFDSQTTANDLRELHDHAELSGTGSDLDKRLERSKHLLEVFHKYVLPLSDNNSTCALDRLKRLRSVPFDHKELIIRVNQKIAQLIYRPDGHGTDPEQIRWLLAEFVLGHLGQKICGVDILAELGGKGYHLRVWSKDRSLLTQVDNLNERYLNAVQNQLINHHAIERAEAAKVVEHLLNARHSKAQLVVGSAGLGKSCVMYEVVEKLKAADIPVICLRLDNLPSVATAQKLGQELGLPESPAVVLAGIANGSNCVLIIDQIDALSLVSGRNEHLWPVFDELIAEAKRIPNMRILLACRAFDLQHDQRLRQLAGAGRLADLIELGFLDVGQVQAAIRVAHFDPGLLSPLELELLRNPFNLQLFLLGNPEKQTPFRSAKDLFDRFWDAKAARTKTDLRDPHAWDDCISTLARALSCGSTSAPVDLLDRHSEDAKILASHGVFAFENNRVRFWHETFGDYAFARQFVRGGGDLVKFLTEGGEQHLYRRAQIRQVLTYERDRDRVSYITTLKRLISDSRVRGHIKKLVFDWLSRLPNPTKEEWKFSIQS
jgi:hypothetical protein